MQICNIFSPSVALGDSSLIRGSLGRYRARRFFDTLKSAARIGRRFKNIYRA